MPDINELRRLLEAGLISPEELEGMPMRDMAGPSVAPQQNMLAQMMQPPPELDQGGMPRPRLDIAPMAQNTMRVESGPNAGRVTDMNFAGQAPQGPLAAEQRLGAAVEVPGRGMGRYSADQRSVVFPDGSTHDLFPKNTAAKAKAAFDRAKEIQGLRKGEAGITHTQEQTESSRTTREQGRQVKPVFNAEMGAWMYPPDANNPNGRVVTPDGQARPAKLTEFQGKSSAFGTRAAEAHEILNAVGQGGKVQPSLTKRAVEGTPLIGGALAMGANKFASSDQRQVEQAERNFINATLRQESGAVISPQEFDNARKQYFPQPNDDDVTIAQKARNRAQVIESFGDSAGPAKEKVIGAGGKARERFDTIKAAQDAIKRGAPPDAVKKRLEAAGITGHGL